MYLIPYLYFSIFIFSVIVFFDILIKFKRPFSLKIILLIIAISIANITLLVSILPDFATKGFVFIFFKAILACSFLQLFSILYFPKSRWFVNILTIIFILFTLFSYFYFIIYYPNFLENYHLKTLIIVGDEGMEVPIFFKIAKRVLFLIFFITWLYFFFNIVTKFNLSNVYFDKIKTWSINFFILSLLVLISNLISIYVDYKSLMGSYFSVLIFFYILLIILYRPAFINKSAIKIKFGQHFTKENNFQISDLIFQTQFYSNMYFLNKEASMENFAIQLKVNSNELYKYIYNKYNMSFNDLLNKNRVAYFLEIIQLDKFKNLSIDALAQEAGFSSRQHLYKPFKKFHGGNPSDLIEANS